MAMAAKTKTKHYYSAHNVATSVFRYVSISARQRSVQCGQNFCGPFLIYLINYITRTTGRQRAHISTTKVSVYNITICLCHCIVAITTV